MTSGRARETHEGAANRHSRARRSTWVLAVVALVGLLGLVPAAPVGADESAPPRPVLMVGGTFAPQFLLEQSKAWLVDAGYDVRTMQLSGDVRGLNLPGTTSMRVSAAAVADNVDAILEETGAERVDIIGHSQGAVVSRYYVKNLGGLETVDGLISLGGVNYGIRPSALDLWTLLVGVGCGVLNPPVCDEIVYDQQPGDTPFLTELNHPDPTPGDVDYFHLYTESDISTTEETNELDGATNLSVQSACPGRQVRHVDEWDDAAMQELMLAALERRPLTSTCPIPPPPALICVTVPLLSRICV